MKLSQRLLPFGCALAMVCLFTVKSEAGQSSGAVPNRVTRTPDENVRVTLAGNVQQAFATQIENFQADGAVYVANASEPQIPAALAPVVAGVVSLHNFPK